MRSFVTYEGPSIYRYTVSSPFLFPQLATWLGRDVNVALKTLQPPFSG